MYTVEIDWQGYNEWYAKRNSVALDESKPLEFDGMSTWDWDDEPKKVWVKQSFNDGMGAIGGMIPLRFVLDIKAVQS